MPSGILLHPQFGHSRSGPKIVEGDLPLFGEGSWVPL